MRPLVLIGLLTLAACDPSGVSYVGPGKPDPASDPLNPSGTTASHVSAYACDLRQNNGSCILFTGDGWDATSMEGGCDGNFNSTGCPPSDLGGCTLTPGAALETLVWYYQGTYYSDADEQTLQSDCEVNQGVWH